MNVRRVDLTRCYHRQPDKATDVNDVCRLAVNRTAKSARDDARRIQTLANHSVMAADLVGTPI
jgi:hypothetical protein